MNESLLAMDNNTRKNQYDTIR